MSDTATAKPDTRRDEGWSSLAVRADKPWDAGDRPVEWQGRVYGMVVHTTGSELPARAHRRGMHHTVEAVSHYSRSHGCHYVNGWGGAASGELIQMANEREQAHGVGVTNDQEPDKDQRRSVDAGRFEADLPPVLVRLWRQRWPGYENSLALLPGTKTANSCYVHVECVPCVYHLDGDLVTAEGIEPMRSGLRFTTAQHDSIVALAVDVADRNGWPADEAWWRTPRLLGHEDLTPISRHDRRGGWDPGYLREAPYFDWDHVYAGIEAQLGRPGRTIVDPIAELPDRISELVAGGGEQLAVALAHQRGVSDVNELTNLLFFARHPEMNGRQIAAHETELAQEWIDLRDSVVRPHLDRMGTG